MNKSKTNVYKTVEVELGEEIQDEVQIDSEQYVNDEQNVNDGPDVIGAVSLRRSLRQNYNFFKSFI